MALTETEHLAVKPSSYTQRWGTAELVALLQRSAARVASVAPGARLHVGDLSREDGGRMSPHRSHRSGRDADVGLYLMDADGQPVMGERFVDIGRDGVARQDPSIRLDEARTWHLVEALVTDTEAPVQFIFLARHLEERLLEEGRRQGASEELLRRVDAVIDAERAHTNHLHVRIYCPVDDVPRCSEDPPFHDWVDRSAAREAIARAAVLEREAEHAAHVRERRRSRGTTRVARSSVASRGRGAASGGGGSHGSRRSSAP